jgi:hypothetical protein
MIQMQSDHNTTVLSLIKEIVAAKSAAPAEAANSSIDQLDKMLSVAERLAGMHGGGTGKRSGWEVGLDYARELGVPGLQLISNLFGKAPVMPTAPGAPAPVPASFDPYANPGALRQYSQQQQQAPAAGAQTQPFDPMSQLVQYAPLIINALNTGIPGYETADAVCLLAGRSAHAVVCGPGEQAIVSGLMMIPQLAMFGQPRLQTWVHEFICFEEYGSDETEESSDEDASAKSPQPPRKTAKRADHSTDSVDVRATVVA